MLNTTSAVIAAAAPDDVTSPSSGRTRSRSRCKSTARPRTLRAEPRMTLAEALRGPLGLTGTKIACNRGACSACTVWLDGAPVCACMMLAIDVGDARRHDDRRSRATARRCIRCSRPSSITTRCNAASARRA